MKGNKYVRIMNMDLRAKLLSAFGVRNKDSLSLSTFFPKETIYFYGYPSGSDDGFFNKVSPEVEEMVAARASSCAGPNVLPISFFSSSRQALGNNLTELLKEQGVARAQALVFPKTIDRTVVGGDRDAMIRDFIIENIKTKNFVMAQPYKGADFDKISLIKPDTTAWLNDKKNLKNFVPEDFLPAELGRFRNGHDFITHVGELAVPFVAKISSSSAGDGVFICKTEVDVAKAVAKIKDVADSVLVTEYIEVYRNFGIQFGVSYTTSFSPRIIGVSEQITTPDGEFLGGIIGHDSLPDGVGLVAEVILSDILPAARELGWFGVGCFDVLIDTQGKAYIIDANFRMTGMTAHLIAYHNRHSTMKAASFSAVFTDHPDSIEGLRHLVKERSVYIAAITKNNDRCIMNASIYFEDKADLRKRIDFLASIGVETKGLEQAFASIV